MTRFVRAILTASIGLLCTGLALAQQPSLPPGLEEEKPKTMEPGLPEGLGAETAPALPPGLESDDSKPEVDSEAAGKELKLMDRLPFPLEGFWEARAGMRTQSDPAQSKDLILGETRLQLETGKDWTRASLEFTGDFYLDAVMEEAEFDLRQLRLTWTPIDSVDVRIGRQILTWGTGDLLFINDLFPKDWNSFFIGRDTEYLKAPSDAIKVGWYNEALNIEIVYTPQFEPDRFITGDRISYWSPLFGSFAGEDQETDFNAPSSWFTDDEIAVRLYRNIGSSEFAVYGYSGYWKSPGGMRFPPMQATFPRLNVYGASLRGNMWKGIGNIEVGYYDSRDDSGGSNSFVNNSEIRLLIGYEQELAKNLTGAVQYYLEHMMDYEAYRNGLVIGQPRDQDRHVLTVRVTKLLMAQNLRLSMFAYYSPSDGDAYLRPNVSYKVNDHWTVEGGANLFMGESDATFFGQFENNSNVYFGARYSF